MKKTAAFIIALLLLVGCRQAPAAYPAQGNKPETRTDSEIAADSLQVQKDIADVFPDVVFSVNKDAAVALKYSGQTAQLTVTDQVGLTWTLSIPEGALAGPTTITMTPLIDFDDGTGTGPKSGVLFEPSGLVFSVPATLTVTGPDVGKDILLYADSKGRDMIPAAFAAGGDSAQALMFHFSTAFVDPVDNEAMKAEADRLYDKYYDKARNLLDKEIRQPKPMSLKLECFEADNGLKGIKEELETLVSEEVKYASALWLALGIALKEKDMAGAQDLNRVIQGLTERALLKLEMLICLDNPKPETYFYAYQSMLLQLQIVGMRTTACAADSNYMENDPIKQSEVWLKAFIGKVRAAGEYTWKFLLDGISEDHEYRYMYTATIAEIMLAETARISAAAKLETGISEEQRHKQFVDACTFTVYFEGTTTQKRDHTAVWTTSGEGKVLLQPADDNSSEDSLVFKGTLKGTYNNYSTTNPTAVKTLLTKEFETEAHLVLELPCCLTGRAGAAQFGADDLTYQSDDGPITVPTGNNIISQLILADYYDALFQAVMAEVSLTPGRSLSEKKIDAKYEYTIVEYTIYLEHTPQSDSRQ